MSLWRRDETEGVLTLTLDVPGHSMNVLSQSVLLELDQLLLDIGHQPLRGVILVSGKTGFVVGADLREFRSIRDSARAAELARAGQMVFDRLAALPFPSVAAISGVCLGGGLELALACQHRVATDLPMTRLGLPEVRLGIHPGFGGSVRLPELIGDWAALDLMLRGGTLSARQAQRLGLVDAVVPERHLRAAALAQLTVPPHRRHWWTAVPRPMRPHVAAWMRRRLRQKARPEHYPAPHRLLDLWTRGASQHEEAVSLGELLVSPASRHLVRNFLAQEDLKRAARATAHDIKRVHVVGAGVMGAGIAVWAAARGFTVSLQDRQPEVLARAFEQAQVFVRKHESDDRARQAVLDRMIPDLQGRMVGRADLVIEAIIENEEAKRRLFAQLERKTAPETLFASNTSSMRIEHLAQDLLRPEQLIGLHFFNPVTRMPLIEVVHGDASLPALLARASSFAVALDRLPLPVASRPGFLVNRVLMPYLLEAVQLVEEGVAPETVDAAAEAFGMPMGPVALADTIGIDICLSVARHLAPLFHADVPELLVRLVAEGRLGKKSGRGFYRYDPAGHSVDPVREVVGSTPEIGERLIWRLLNEAVACRREQVVADAQLVDLGLVFGAGFAPFLGGPLAYAETVGTGPARQILARLTERFGPRFEADPGWLDASLFNRPDPTP